jgi:hexosaminidase
MLLAYLALSTSRADQLFLDVVPKPANAISAPGGPLKWETIRSIEFSRGAQGEARMLADELKNDGSAKLGTRGGRETDRHVVRLDLDPAANTGDEGYKMSIGEDGVRITASNTAGLFYGGQTLRQLAEDGAPIPSCIVDDSPTFGWRGLLLDVSRHFRPKADIERYLDVMAAHKLNTFHWHLVDDGGWRIEIKKYPLLTSRGAWRSTPQQDWSGNIVFPEKHSNDEYGGFYTQNDIREVVSYAAARHITIVPEIEMPGHSFEAVTCYPNVACTKPDGSGPVLNSNYCPGKEATFEFLDNVLDEVMALFPSKFIHIGGDEVDKTSWHQCPDCQARIKAEGLKDEEALQSYLIKRIEKHINEKGRRLIGWDEILEGGLAPNATVMSWRGIQGGIAAAKQGKNVVMCPTSHCYFDYPYSSTSVEKVYSYQPIPDELSGDQAKLVLGGQGNLWTERIPTRARLDAMTWPRAAALAEVFWTPASQKDWGDFSKRMTSEYKRLGAMGVNYWPPTPVTALSAVITDRPVAIEFGAPEPGPFTLRYTTNGQAPDTSSLEVKGSVQVVHTAVIKAAYFNESGGHGDVVTVQVHIGPIRAPSHVDPGLSVEYYEGQWGETLPDFGKLSPLSASVVNTIDTASRKRDENYALKFTGTIDIPTDGPYTFWMTSDDGAQLSIADALVIDEDGGHAALTKSGTVTLDKGRYPFEVTFYQVGGPAILDVSVAAPGLTKGHIPPSWLGH